jgi:hypothetical protein
MPKFYVVRKGRRPGIYTDWTECNAQISGFSGSEYKSFPTYDLAEKYFRETQTQSPPLPMPALQDPRDKEFLEIKQKIDVPRDKNLKTMKINHTQELADLIAECAECKITIERKHQLEMKKFYEFCDQQFAAIKEKHKQELEKVNQITEEIDVAARFKDLEAFINPANPIINDE